MSVGLQVLLLSVVGLLEFVGLGVGTGTAGLGATTNCGAGLGASIGVGNVLGGCDLGGLGGAGCGAEGLGVNPSINFCIPAAEAVRAINIIRIKQICFIC
jgi:hypothetical protein